MHFVLRAATVVGGHEPMPMGSASAVAMAAVVCRGCSCVHGGHRWETFFIQATLSLVRTPPNPPPPF